MRNKLKSVAYKATKCDSGETLNPFLHVFMFMTLVFAVGFLFFGESNALQAVVLYQETSSLGGPFVNIWGAVGLAVILAHTAGFFARGKWMVGLLPISIAGGFYLWLWASLIYLSGGFVFQFLVICLPNLFFWSWYAVQYRRRKRGERVAFV